MRRVSDMPARSRPRGPKANRQPLVVWNDWRLPCLVAPRYALRMAPAPDYFIETSDTGTRPFPWRWEIGRRRSKPTGVKLGGSGYQSKTAAKLAGEQALVRFLRDLEIEKRRR